MFFFHTNPLNSNVLKLLLEIIIFNYFCPKYFFAYCQHSFIISYLYVVWGGAFPSPVLYYVFGYVKRLQR